MFWLCFSITTITWVSHHVGGCYISVIAVLTLRNFNQKFQTLPEPVVRCLACSGTKLAASEHITASHTISTHDQRGVVFVCNSKIRLYSINPAQNSIFCRFVHTAQGSLETSSFGGSSTSPMLIAQLTFLQ